MSFKTGIIAENFGSIFDTSGLNESHADSRSFAALFEEGMFDRLFIASINVLEWTGVRVNIVYNAAPNAKTSMLGSASSPRTCLPGADSDANLPTSPNSTKAHTLDPR